MSFLTVQRTLGVKQGQQHRKKMALLPPITEYTGNTQQSNASSDWWRLSGHD
uniref:Uncharacterized protein n=1 Tax=Anguilla anguilla TaxID=7936 RepID=A0A0E9UAR6_ANGAN